MSPERLPMPELVAQRIHFVRGLKVMLDADLATLYDVETKALVQAVKRNPQRFPPDFMFQLSEDEWVALGSQIVTSKGRGGRRYAPYAFTEHGALMLSTHKELAAKLDVLERKVGTHDQAIAGLMDAIRQLMRGPASSGRPIGFTADLNKRRS